MRMRHCKIVIADVTVDKGRRSLWRARLPVSDKGTGGLHGKNRSGAQVVAINRVITATQQNGNLIGRAIGVKLKPRTIPR
jgi:hypothetical protein